MRQSRRPIASLTHRWDVSLSYTLSGDSPLVIWLKRWDAKLLHWSFGHARTLLAGALAAEPA